MIAAPTIGSRWLDTGARNVPPAVDAKANPNATLRRIVEVRDVGPTAATILGMWQQQDWCGSTATPMPWETVLRQYDDE